MCKFIFASLLFMLNSWQAQAQTQSINITGPAGSGQFGQTITVLPNGNYVVTDPLYDDGSIPDVGAVYLYNGSTHSLVSTLKGSTANDQVGGPSFSANTIIVLKNGNFLVRSTNWSNGEAIKAGAVTWCSGTTGLSEIVSSSNSLVGSSANDEVGTAVLLNNDNYLVINPYWDNGTAADAGAVTWGSGSSGISGVVNSSNSLVGSSANDKIGWYGITFLSNGNYVVRSVAWDNGSATDAGAVTWGSGTSGISGIVSSTNSLVGDKLNDNVGYSGIVTLSNGNYIVISPYWDNGSAADAGAVTWGNGTAGVTGIVSTSNSLVGSTTNDWVGIDDVTPLSNGNYVVISSRWDNGSAKDAGAVTWANGTTGMTGVMSAGNSLVGSTTNDQVGAGRVVALTNGNYVVNSPNWWDIERGVAGAATWGDGTIGSQGIIGRDNSLVGSFHTGGGGIIALNNGNYVVCSPDWDNGPIVRAGAATWANGTTGITGEISNTNSLIGSKAYDQVGYFVTPLSNGNYVVSSPTWNNGTATSAGAVTWANGNTGAKGVVDSANSLTGTTSGDRVGYRITALANGNYVVNSPTWSNGTATNAGAVTWANGDTGIKGVADSSNSLVGRSGQDGVGGLAGLTELSNGNYVVSSHAGVTWANGITGTTGVISSSNSLVGNTTNDLIGMEVVALSNGNYLVESPFWDNGVAADAGAITWGNGVAGTTGVVGLNNSLVGNATGDWPGTGGIIAIDNGDYMVYSPNWDNGAAIDAGAITWGSGSVGVAGAITSCNSWIGTTSGETNLAYNDLYSYMIIGRPFINTVTVYIPETNTSAALATAMDTISVNITGNATTPLIASDGCRIIASLTSTGANPINGTINARVWIEDTVSTHNGNPFVVRHYQITPVTNASTSTGTVTLYFTQKEFDDFNAHPGSTLNLPTGEGDATGKSNLRIYKYPGTSSDGSGLPGSYSGAPTVIDPADADVTWRNGLDRWEVSFGATGFSGFFVQTNLPILPLTLLEFTARIVNHNAVLNWITADELTTLSFDVERSIDGRVYSTIGNVNAINQPGNHQYSYTDNNTMSLGASVVYYRLRQRDIDGRFAYSGIVALPVGNSRSILMFYPNPVYDEANLTIAVSAPVRLRASIVDYTGRIVKRLQFNLEPGSTSVPIDVRLLGNGVYYLDLEGGTINERVKFVKL